MADTEIIKEDGETRGRYVVTIGGHEAELTYSKLGDSGNVIADPTGVPEELGGRGVGSALVRYLVEDARSLVVIEVLGGKCFLLFAETGDGVR